MKTQEAINEIEKLGDGESWIYPEGDYGRAEIWLKNDRYFLFTIPCFGGKPIYYGAYLKKETDYIIKIVEEWT